jgi:hypothetical protein
MGVLHMDSRTRRAASWWWTAVLVLLAALAAYASRPAVRTVEAAPAPPQDVIRIEGRISQLEQRFYTIETSIRGLEQQLRLAGVNSQRAARDPEIGLLRAEVEALGRRLAEIECGLAKVDERTLSAAAKESRRKSAGVVGDPCRLNTDTPVRLPARP